MRGSQGGHLHEKGIQEGPKGTSVAILQCCGCSHSPTLKNTARTVLQGECVGLLLPLCVCESEGGRKRTVEKYELVRSVLQVAVLVFTALWISLTPMVSDLGKSRLAHTVGMIFSASMLTKLTATYIISLMSPAHYLNMSQSTSLSATCSIASDQAEQRFTSLVTTSSLCMFCLY